jgi:hypothetical protein
MKKAAEASLGGFPFELARSSWLSAVPASEVVAANQAIAIGRDGGPRCFASLANDQHDRAKVNSSIESVKSYLRESWCTAGQGSM